MRNIKKSAVENFSLNINKYVLAGPIKSELDMLLYWVISPFTINYLCGHIPKSITLNI